MKDIEFQKIKKLKNYFYFYFGCGNGTRRTTFFSTMEGASSLQQRNYTN